MAMTYQPQKRLPTTSTRRPWAVVAAVVAFLASVATESRADRIEYRFSGKLNDADPSTPAATDGHAAGTPFTGSFAYDPNETPTVSSTIQGSSNYMFGQAGPNTSPDSSGLSIQVGGQTVYSLTGGLGLTVDMTPTPGVIPTPGPYPLPTNPHTHVGFSSGLGGASMVAGIDLWNDNAAVLGSLAPPSSLNLSDFTAAMNIVADPGTAQSRILYQGTIDVLVEVTTPEPSTLLVIGLAGAGFLARRKFARA